MAKKIQHRRDTSTNWTSNNPILSEGEIGIETDTVKLKIGDGATAWSSLVYYNSGGLTIEEIASVTSLDSINDNSIIYKDNSGILQSVSLGASSTILTSNGATSAPSFEVGASLVPTDITVASESTDTTCFPSFFTAETGDLGPKTNSGLTFNSSTGILGATGFSGPLTGNVTGDCSGNAGTVSTITGLAPDTATTEATQTNITTCANLTTIGTVTSGGLSTGASLGDVTMSIGSDADGDMYYRSSNKLTRLPKGTANQVLQMNTGATAPEWTTSAGGSSGIEERTSDYSAESANTGKMWMRTDESSPTVKGVIKYSGGTNAWITGGNLNTASSGVGGAGTQTAGLAFGGNTGSLSNITEEYDGSSWTTGGNLNTARYWCGGAGTQTAGLSFGGSTGVITNVTEEYDGTSWSSGGNLNTTRSSLGGAGTQTAGLAFGGNSGSASNITEEYNGSSWTSGGNLSTARLDLSGCGTQTAGLSFGGFNGSILNVTEEYDGTSWSSGGSLNTASSGLGGAGTQTAGLSFGGNTGTVYNLTEEYNGTSWSSGGNLNTGRYYLGGAGTQSAGLSFGGDSGSISNVTEEYNPTSYSYAVKTFTIT